MKSIFLASLLSAQVLSAQSSLHLIKATSKVVSIDDDGDIDHNWRLTPQARPDIFTADRTRKTKWVTFHTDIDSIRVKVKPGSRFTFIVLLNGKDSCYTQIASAIPPELETESPIVTHDTVPFILSPTNAIQVSAVVNDTAVVNLHFDVGSFDFRLTKEVIASRHLEKVVKIQMGKLIWANPDVAATAVTATGMDGRFGWNLFEGKTVEINYDQGLLVIHSRRPKVLKGYVRSKLSFIHSLVCVKGTFDKGHRNYASNFIFDTGSSMAVIMDSTWADKQQYIQDLTLIKTSELRDPRGIKYTTRIVNSPKVVLNGFELTDVPTYVLGSQNPARFEVNFLGNDLLKRFNILLDFKHDAVYLKPNTLVGLKYKDGA